MLIATGGQSRASARVLRIQAPDKSHPVRRGWLHMDDGALGRASHVRVALRSANTCPPTCKSRLGARVRWLRGAPMRTVFFLSGGAVGERKSRGPRFPSKLWLAKSQWVCLRAARTSPTPFQAVANFRSRKRTGKEGERERERM